MKTSVLINFILLILITSVQAASNNESNVNPQKQLMLENDNFSLAIDTASGAITSFIVKKNNCDLIGEKRLKANFRICLPLKDYQCNYIEGTEQKPAEVTKDGDKVTVKFDGMSSPKGKFPIKLTYTIALNGDQIVFHSKLTNNSKDAISEFWFPRLGGWTNFGDDRDSAMQFQSYQKTSNYSLFNGFPGRGELRPPKPLNGTQIYPGTQMPWNFLGLQMPWIDIYNSKSDTGLYLGYHDDIFLASHHGIFIFIQLPAGVFPPG